MTTLTGTLCFSASRYSPGAFDARLAGEDAAEEALRLVPDDRVTCPLHHRWIHQCVASPAHINAVTRHRWCRRCAVPLPVVIDEIAGTATIVCPRCGDGSSPATTRLITACRASLAASRKDGHRTDGKTHSCYLPRSISADNTHQPPRPATCSPVPARNADVGVPVGDKESDNGRR
ncbi:hypothetical protein MLGJGCBP_00185 [Rhodococcus sp. T7]|nr:hypothetical protein MLGJGCBP_00185 [Rhodococcus sp. T7]